MSAFHDASQIGNIGERRIIEWLKSWPQVIDAKRIVSLDEQFKGRDILVTLNDNSRFTVEVKTEANDKYGNLFLETWSNRTTQRQGWLYTCQADFFVYQFANQPWGYWFQTKNLQSWATSCNVPEKMQQKRQQHNDTWGMCANIQIVIASTNSKIIQLDGF